MTIKNDSEPSTHYTGARAYVGDSLNGSRSLPLGLLVTAAALFASSFNAIAATPSPQRDPSTAACVDDAAAGMSGDSSSSCWTVYAAAMAVNDYRSAAEAVRLGCERDKRADFCMFAAQWGATAASVREAATNAAKYNIRRAAERAETFVTTVEIEDVEQQLARYELARVLTNQKRRALRAGRALASSDGAQSEPKRSNR